jgi:LysM repeat protein
MKIKIAFVILICLSFTKIYTQELISQGIAPNLFLTHKVTPKENWFSVGRLYNVNAKELAKFNKITVEKGLAIDQSIKIPLTATNLVTDINAITSEEAAIPYYRIIGKSEGLYRTALNAGTTMQLLRNYNNLTSDALSTGTKLIVGYLKIKKSESSLLSTQVVGLDVPPVQEVIEVPKKEIPTPVVEKPIVKKEEPVIILKEKPEVIKETPKKVTPIVHDDKIYPKSDGKNKEGFFKNDYDKQTKFNKEIEGNAAAFKTVAGWTDNKFYVLIDGINPGTILQITNKSNNKVVYAKVLGEMQELKQNNGLKLRISNATANALDITNEVFLVSIKY